MSRTPPTRPFPVADLVPFLPRKLSGVVNQHKAAEDLALDLDPTAERDFHRLKAQGALSVAQADRWALRVGRHPAEIWDSW